MMMMVKIKKIKEENEDDEYVKSSNKSSTPLLLPRLANGRTSLCRLLWCCCFLVLAFFFFFKSDEDTCKREFFKARTRQREDERWFVREMFFFLSLFLGVEQKKKSHTCIYFAGTNNVSHALHTRKASVVITRVAVPVTP